MRWPILLVLAWFAPACSSSGGGEPAAPDAGEDAVVDAAPEVSLDDPPIDARYAAFAKAFDDERVSLGAPGAAVALIEHGKVTFAHGFGTKGPNSKEPVRARTLFRIGSTTKALTAVALMQQVDAGKVDLSAPVTTVIPKLAINGSELGKLQIAHVLSQQSGVADYLSVDVGASMRTDGALASFVTSGLRAHTYFMNPPGVFWNYSNPNYYIAGAIAETAAGVPYRTLLTTKVFAPLGMNRTFFLPDEVVADGDFANGKSTNQDGTPWDVSPTSYDNGWGRPAGYAFSNVLDYAKFVQFLYAGNPAVLSDASRAEMQSKKIDTLEYGHIENYGYATFVYDGVNVGPGEFISTKVVTHGGDIPGYAADFYLIPATGFGVVSYANADGAHFRESLALAMKSFGELPAPMAPPDLKVDAATFDAFVGSYDDPHNVGAVTIAKSGTDLTITMPAVDSAGVPYDKKLDPVLPDNFLLSIQGTKVLLTFIKDASGKVTWMRTRPFVAQRTAMPPSGFKVDAAKLRAVLRTLPRDPLLLR